MSNKKPSPLDRINYSGNVSALIWEICKAYGIDPPKKHHIVEVGYEDCNMIMDSGNTRYLAKIFSKKRTITNIKRYSKIIEKVTEAGIHHPKLIKTRDGKATYSFNNVSLVLLQFVEGRTFFELDRAPGLKELKAVLEQASKINNIEYRPKYLFDSWAIPNIERMFTKTKKFIEEDDQKLVKEVISRYKKIPVDKIPHCFVHGDFTKANVVKGKDNRIYVLDFSVSNWSPRIQELAVIAANLTYDERSKLKLQQRCEIIAREYSKFTPLTPQEYHYLPTYALAGVAMEFMGSHQEKFIKGNDTKETEYWLKLGRNGLRQALKK